MFGNEYTLGQEHYNDLLRESRERNRAKRVIGHKRINQLSHDKTANSVLND